MLAAEKREQEMKAREQGPMPKPRDREQGPMPKPRDREQGPHTVLSQKVTSPIPMQR